MVFLDLERRGQLRGGAPSGTEPKVKFYLFAYDPPAAGRDLTAVKAAQAARLSGHGGRPAGVLERNVGRRRVAVDRSRCHRPIIGTRSVGMPITAHGVSMLPCVPTATAATGRP